MSRKYISLLLCIAMIISLLPGNIHAEGDVQPTEKKEVRDSFKELVDQRTAESKTFIDEEGNFKKEIHSNPIHHKKNGKWENISNRLIEKNNPEEVETEDTDINAKFPKKLKQNKAIKYTFGDYHLSLSVLSATNGEQTISPNTSEMITEDNKILYENVFNGVDLRHITLNEEVKEDWIVNEYNGLNQFNYEVKTDLTPKLEENGAVGFYKDQEQKGIVFKLPAPLMEDSNYKNGLGNGVKSTDLHYELLQNGKSSYIIKLVVDKKWLESSERVFPVYIDPSVTIGAPGDTFVSSAYPSNNYNKEWDSSQGEYILKAGYYDSTTGTNYAFMKFSIVGDLKGAIIDSATLKAYVTHAYYTTTDTGLWVDRALGQWYADELTWSNKPSSTNITSTSVARDEWASFNLTSTVQNFVKGDYDNFGFKLHTNGNGQTYWKKITAGESPNEARLVITYHYPTTTKPTTKSFNSGSNSGYVDLKWSTVTGATGYKVWVFNGKAYEAFNVGNVTSWSTKGRKIWPTTTEVADGRYDLHQDSLGAELPEDPSPVYRNSGGGTYDTKKNYAIRVSAVFSGGESPTSEAAVPTIPNMDIPTKPIGTMYTYGNGTGYTDLTWTSVSGATGYKVWIFNGISYESFDVGNVTKWSTKGLKIWPTTAEISSKRYALHHDKLGSELSVDPASVYANAGTQYANTHNYYFRVSAYNTLGETVYSTTYFSPTMPNLKLPAIPTGTAYNNSDNTGYVDLSWAPVSGATGYKVWIWNGIAYESIDVKNVTSWSTKAKKIWPTENEITQKKFKIHTDQTGVELAVDPSPVYVNSGGTYGTSKKYYFRISAYNTLGETVYSNSPFTPTIPGIAYIPNDFDVNVQTDINQISLSWKAVSGATKYQVLNEELETIYEGNNLGYTDSLLSSGTIYQYTIKALDSANNVINKVEISTMTKDEEFSEALSVSAIVSNDAVKLVWPANPNQEEYVIYRDGDEIGKTTGTIFTDNSINNNEEYVYTIQPSVDEFESTDPTINDFESMSADTYVATFTE